MEIQKIKLVYFSPTGTTRKILESIARGYASANVEQIDLTLPDGANNVSPFAADELVVLGAPVYGGRLPVTAIKRFQQLQASKSLAVSVVVYGNREFEDALLELKNLAIDLGCCPIAGGAFIGEHSFATKDAPIANGRPDDLDVQLAMEFGAKIKERIATLQDTGARLHLNIPGRYPYEGGAHAMAVSPLTNADTCSLCGTCASVCPTAAISIDGSVATTIERCIRCCACIKNCPTESRYWEDAKIHKIKTWLTENCAARKEPQVFLAVE